MATEPEQPHLVALVLQSKKALQHGEQLCTNARSISTQSAQAAVDVLALDAKVRWMTDAVLQQLKLAAGVAKIIEQKRAQLEAQAKGWDDLRNQRTSALDSVLDSLGTQFVPPDFYSTSPISSLFGSQNNSDDEADDDKTTGFKPGQSPTETLRDVLRNGFGQRRYSRTRDNDRSHWKTLRDFVDERSIEDLLEAIEADRNVLDDILAKTSGYPEQLANTISAIEGSLPIEIIIPPMDDIFNMQEAVSEEMANHLHSLTGHYEQMAQALHDNEAGETFSDTDMQEMNRDTEELPAIIADLEKNIASIRESHEQLLSAKRVAQEQLDSHRTVLSDLDSLGDIMSDMLQDQDNVEDDFNVQLSLLDETLGTIEELHARYTKYQYSYCKLVIELARRRRYAEAASKIVQNMTSQLNAMTEEERQTREDFNGIHGEHLPLDVCPSIQNPPTRYEILPWHQDTEETLPYIDEDLLTEAIDRIAQADGKIAGSQSL